MFHKFGSYCDQVIKEVWVLDHEQWEQWGVVVFLVVIVGIFLLRGHGPHRV